MSQPRFPIPSRWRSVHDPQRVVIAYDYDPTIYIVYFHEEGDLRDNHCRSLEGMQQNFEFVALVEENTGPTPGDMW